MFALLFRGSLTPDIYFYFFTVLLLSLWLQKCSFFAVGSLAPHVFPFFLIIRSRTLRFYFWASGSIISLLYFDISKLPVCIC